MIEVANKFNMVDIGGIDVVESQGETVDGLYTKLLNSVQNCRYTVLYNWSFAGIQITPTPIEITIGDNMVVINDAITITSDDVVHVASLEIPVYPPLSTLSVAENGSFEPPDGIYGFDKVNVSVSDPPLRTLSVAENGVFEPPEGIYGFDRVNVNVPIVQPVYQVVEPDYFGLSYSFISTTGVYAHYTTKTNVLFFATLESGFNYVTFLPEQYSNRFRVCVWANREYSEFADAIDQSATGNIFTGGTMVTPTTELSGDGMERRFFFQSDGGTIVIMTSSTSQLIRPILLKMMA